MIDLQIKAYAKINLSLNVTGKRADGYHDIHSYAMPALDLADHLAIGLRDTGKTGITLDIDGAFAPSVPLNDSTLHKAYWRYAQTTGFDRHVHVHLQKDIPATAGLGGGSADAAALLRALHFLRTGGDEPDRALYDIASGVGADVPACLMAQPCLVQGLGDKLTPVDLPQLYALAVWPGPGPSTADMYASLSGAVTTAPAKPPEDIAQWAAGLCNDFEATAIAKTPAVGEALEALRAIPNCYAARLTGSGTAVFGLFADNRPIPAPALARVAGFPAFRTRLGNPKKTLVTIGR